MGAAITTGQDVKLAEMTAIKFTMLQADKSDALTQREFTMPLGARLVVLTATDFTVLLALKLGE